MLTDYLVQRKKEKAIGEVMQDNLTEDDLDDILGGGDGKATPLQCSGI